MALPDCTGVCTPDKVLFLWSVKARSCGHVHNPSASGGLPLELDTPAEVVHYQDQCVQESLLSCYHTTMKTRIDLHVHSKLSGDTDAEPEELIMHAIKQGLHGIAFTEHYSYEVSEPLEEMRERYKDKIMIFRGVEFSALEGHCLIFGVNTDALSISHLPLEEMVRIVNESGGVVIPSHPYRKGNSLGDVIKNAPGICALEGYNGCNMHAYNAKAVEMARVLSIPYTGGSDAHLPAEVGLCLTEFEDEVTPRTLVPLLKKGNYRGFDNRPRFSPSTAILFL